MSLLSGTNFLLLFHTLPPSQRDQPGIPCSLQSTRAAVAPLLCSSAGSEQTAAPPFQPRAAGTHPHLPSAFSMVFVLLQPSNKFIKLVLPHVHNLEELATELKHQVPLALSAKHPQARRHHRGYRLRQRGYRWKSYFRADVEFNGKD